MLQLKAAQWHSIFRGYLMSKSMTAYAGLEKYVCMRRASYFSTILCLCTHKIMEFLFWEEAYDFHKFPDDALEPIRLFSLNFQSMLMKACCKIPRYCQSGQNRVYTHAFLSGINNMVPWGLWSIWSAKICFWASCPKIDKI